MKNTLILAAQAPDEFAYHLMKGLGYLSIIAGEVVYIIECIPIKIKYRKAGEFCLHLPIYRGNQTSCLTLRTHIITNKGTYIEQVVTLSSQPFIF